MFILEGKPLALDTPFTTSDERNIQQIGWRYLHSKKKKQLVSQNKQILQFNQRYYWGYDADGNLIPKQLEDEVVTPEGGEPYTQTDLRHFIFSRQKKQQINSFTN